LDLPKISSIILRVWGGKTPGAGAVYSFSEPGKIVTKARGGQSWHNFGLAFDVGIFSTDGKNYYGESAAYREVGKIGKALGLEWGGDWDFVDEPHFQYNPRGYSLDRNAGAGDGGERFV
jgi:hypothetical protein